MAHNKHNKQIELSAGTIEYEDTGDTGNGNPGDGRTGRNGGTVVLLHGLLMDGSLWDEVTTELSRDFRCVVPTLPLGAHRLPAHAGADLSPQGVARLVGELLERLDLDDVTLVGNDTGGALVQLLAAEGSPRVGRIVLASCDAFDNWPPGLTGKTVVALGKLPPALFGLFMQQMRVRMIRRLPVAFGWLTKRGDAATARWMQPLLHDARIRRDAVAVLRGIAANRRVLLDAAERLAAYRQPALVVWAEKDRVMPPEHGRRLAELLPDARLVEIADSATLLPLDQPGQLAGAIRTFVSDLSSRIG